MAIRRVVPLLRPLTTLVACSVLAAGAHGVAAGWAWPRIVVWGVIAGASLFAMAMLAGGIARRLRRLGRRLKRPAPPRSRRT